MQDSSTMKKILYFCLTWMLVMALQIQFLPNMALADDGAKDSSAQNKPHIEMVPDRPIEDQTFQKKDNEESWLSRNKWWVIIGGVIVGGAAVASSMGGGDDGGGSGGNDGSYRLEW